MRVYTKEWHELSDYLVTVEDFEPVEDKEYTDADIESLYQKRLEKYLDEQKEMSLEYPDDDFYDEKEEIEFFEELYKESLEDPDEDVPAWIRESVDARLIALGVLPESVYNKLKEEMVLKQKRFDELEELAERMYEDGLHEDDEHYEEYDETDDVIDDIMGGYILDIRELDDSVEIEYVTWDDGTDDDDEDDDDEFEDAGIDDEDDDDIDDDVEDADDDDDDDEEDFEDVQIRRIATFSGARVLEFEKPEIKSEYDEDGDIESNCDIIDYELYYEAGRYEVHMLLDNGEHGFKYLTLNCESVSAE